MISHNGLCIIITDIIFQLFKCGVQWSKNSHKSLRHFSIHLCLSDQVSKFWMVSFQCFHNCACWWSQNPINCMNPSSTNFVITLYDSCTLDHAQRLKVAKVFVKIYSKMVSTNCLQMLVVIHMARSLTS